MKKVLFATTALIASAGIAAADGHANVTIGGYGFAGFVDNGTTTDVSSKIRLTFKATVETDAGVTFGASTRTNIVNGNNGGADTTFERSKITIDAGGLSVAVGATNGAMRSLARGATFYGFDDGGTIGFDNSTSDDLADSGNNIYAAYSTGGLTFGIATDADGNNSEFGVQYKAGSFTVGLAGNDSDSIMLSAKYNSDTIDVTLGLADDATANTELVVLALSYDVSSAFEISAAVADTGAGESFGLQGSYDLGGANLVGTVGETAAGASVASLGVIFSF